MLSCCATVLSSLNMNTMATSSRSAKGSERTLQKSWDIFLTGNFLKSQLFLMRVKVAHAFSPLLFYVCCCK